MTEVEPQYPNYYSLNCAEILIEDKAWLEIKGVDTVIKDILAKILKNDENISLLLTNDKNIKKLNYDFRNMDKPTNVLSFPSDDKDFLGDIAISINTLQKESDEQDKDFMHHFIHMLVHGILHLKGYDHIEENEAEEMESHEIKILEDMGVKNPYIWAD